MKAHIVNSGRDTGLLSQYPAKLISRLEPGLIVDVGAAIGDKTLVMRKANPASRVIAYEPFPGNLPYLEKNLQGDQLVTVRAAAVADYEGTGKLFLHSIMDARDKRWAATAGACRAGKLGPFLLRKAAAKTDVPVVTLDSEIREHVRFLKIDVQGGEFNVLQGARRLIETHRVDLIYAEFNGDWRVLRFLDAQGYLIIDCVYMAWPTRRYFWNFFRAKRDWKIPDWEVLNRLDLSTGQRAVHVWPRVPFRSLALYSAWLFLTRVFASGLQTDLLCVHKSFWNEFERACAAARGG